MIPKIIHYCWFGGKEKPESVKRCINSWKLHLPDYEIIEWNENNYDVNSHQFVKEAYETKKFGFIVDVLRMHTLNELGGIYLDTDVEFIRSLPDYFLEQKAFGSFEVGNLLNVGLLASEKNGDFVHHMLNVYKEKHFIIEGKPNLNFTGPIGTTEYLKSIGFLMNGTFEQKDIFTIYSADYFSPKDYKTGLCEITDNTVCIHLYDATWVDEKLQKENQLKDRLIKSILDCKTFMSNRAILGLSYRTLNIKSIKQFISVYLK
jgi:hypothetical protein